MSTAMRPPALPPKKLRPPTTVDSQEEKKPRNADEALLREKDDIVLKGATTTSAASSSCSSTTTTSSKKATLEIDESLLSLSLAGSKSQMQIGGSSSSTSTSSNKRRRAKIKGDHVEEQGSEDSDEVENDEDDDEYVPYQSLKERRKQRTVELNKLRRKAELVEDDADEAEKFLQQKLDKLLSERSTEQQSLLAQSAEMRRKEEESQVDKEEAMIKEIEENEKKLMVQMGYNAPLRSAKENAKGIEYNASMPPIGGWRPLPKHRELSEEERTKIRETFMMECAGRDLPPPIKKFSDMRFPRGILNALKAKEIARPTQIQMQGLPAALSGRDLIGIAFTGSGKTMVFVLPMLMLAMDVELRQPVRENEGPFALMLAPSRELAVQTNDNLQFLLNHLHEDRDCELYKRNRRIKSALVMGGQPMSAQIREVRRGVHCVIATPGRLNGLLTESKMHLKQCRYLAMDEADRMVDATFEEEVRITLDHFTGQRQTLLFSATMPKKIQDFAASMLVNPVIVNVGRAGSANLDIIQEVEYVKQEDKHKMVLQCLKKTPPPVLVFCDSKGDVDDVQEYLLLKGVDAVSIHGGLDQHERLDAINGFKDGSKHVLIGTDVASKGLDFPHIQHVINYDMPKEIENYIHRIGRTGRRGRSGVATTFINKIQCSDGILLDLKAVLEESKQHIHPVLQKIVPPPGHEVAEIGGIKGCIYCGGLGHRVAACPKLESAQRETTRTDVLVTGSRHGRDGGYVGDW
ncbi:unnamed protein product [Amoebophrya sp. A25]|nr:unnamed protein product [Amoebophrya sp. A25]|eukprot:GSA25T00017930001.1